MAERRDQTRFELLVELDTLERDRAAVDPRDSAAHEDLQQRVHRLRRKVESHVAGDGRPKPE